MRLIGISGKIGAGKDTVGVIIRQLAITNNGADWDIRKFAGKLKIVASLLTGISIEKFEDQEFKKTILGPEWGKETRSNPLNAIEPFKDITFVEMMSVRDLLQKLGTEAMRNGLHQNTWVNALFADFKEDMHWIITDMRFPNEYKAIKDKGGITIRVNRPGHGTSMTDLASAHPSETALDGFEFDYTINNDGDLDKLISLVREILVNEAVI
jgi:hypothetical protein